MTHFHPALYLKNSALAGVAGIVTGTVIHSIYQYPETGKKTLVVSTLSGGVGLGIGYAFGVIRKKNVYVYSLSTGLNFFIVPLVFFGIRQVVQTGDATPKFLKNEQTSFAISNPYALSVTSGSVTGCLTSLYSIKRSLKSTVLFAMTGCVLGVSGQYIYNAVNKWRIHKAMKIHYPELFDDGKEVTWEEWLDNLVSRKRKLGQLDDKIAQLEIEFEVLEKEERELLKQQQS